MQPGADRRADSGWNLHSAGLLGAILLPILAAYAILLRYMVDMPFIDDYPVMLGFSVKYVSLPSWGARLHFILADQWVEYKLVLVHLLSALELAATHRIDFAFQFWIGNLALIPLLYLLWRMYFARDAAPLNQRLLLFLPIAFLLFSLNYAEALDWSAAALAYIGTIALCFASILFISQPDAGRVGRHTAAACLCVLAACLNSASGFFLLPFGLYFLWRRRAFGWAAAWCAMFALGIAPYFVHYAKDLRTGNGPLYLIPLYFFSFLGAGTPIIKLAIPAGAAILAIMAWAVRAGYHRTHPAAMLGAAWIVIAAAAAAVGRGRTGLAFSLASRYKIFSDLLLIFCYAFLADRVLHADLSHRARRRLYAVALLGSILFCIRFDVQGAGILKARRALLLAGAEHFRQAPGRNSPMWFNSEDHDTFFAGQEADARQWMIEAERLQLYTLPPAPNAPGSPR
jgi:hypothetical protein